MSSHQQYIEQFKNFAEQVIESHTPTRYVSVDTGTFKNFHSHWNDYGTKVNSINKLIGDKAIELLESASNDSAIDIAQLKYDFIETALQLVNAFIAKWNPRALTTSGKRTTDRYPDNRFYC